MTISPEDELWENGDQRDSEFAPGDTPDPWASSVFRVAYEVREMGDIQQVGL